MSNSLATRLRQLVLRYPWVVILVLGVLALIPRAGRTPLAQRMLVPLFVAGLAWTKREALAKLARRPSFWGLPLILLGIGLNIAGTHAIPELLVPLGMAVVAVGLGFALLGVEIMRVLAFPAAFLLFMVPWQTVLIPPLATPMREFTVWGSTVLAHLTGVPVQAHGYELRLPSYTFYVAVECSGLQALMAFAAMSSLYGYFTRAALWKRWLIFLSGIPLALLLNVVRVWTILMSAYWLGPDIAMKVFHEYSAPLLFMLLVMCFQSVKTAIEECGKHGSPAAIAPAGQH